MPNNLETTASTETPNHTPRGDISAEGMGLITLVMGGLFLCYGIYRSVRGAMNYFGDKEVKNRYG